MNTAPTLICATCNGPISPEDLAQGLAVRVDGQTICPMCVDLLPGRAQFEINKLRALKGFNATTYRVLVPNHREHQRFTFTTAGNVMGHYRTLHSDGEFVAPLLPDSARLVRVVGHRAPTRTPSAVVTAPSTDAPAAPAHLRATPWLIYALGACASLLAALIGLVLWQSHRRPSAVVHHQVLVLATKSRSDYPAEPLEAWEMASTDGHCPPEILSQIDHQLRHQLDADMDQAQSDISQHAFSTAQSDLSVVHVPAEPSFEALRQRARDLTALLSATRTAAASVLTSHDPLPPPEATTPEAPITPAVVTPPPTPVVVEPPGAGSKPTPQPSPGECWLIRAGELMVAGASDWGLDGVLRGSSGELQRTLPALRGGVYQVWVHATNQGTQPGSLILMVDGQIVDTLASTHAGGYLWHALAAQTPLTPGVHQLQIEAAGGGWRLTEVYLASVDHGPPDAATTATTPPWPAAGPDAAMPKPQLDPSLIEPAQQRFIQEWKSAFSWPNHVLPEALDGSSSVPSPWPSGGAPFVRAQAFSAAGDGTLVLRVAKQDVIDGGMVVLVHPMRFDRKSLQVRLEWTPTDAPAADSKHPNAITLDPLVFSSEAWQVFPIPFPDCRSLPTALRLRLSDTVDFGPDLRGFLVGSAVTVAHGTPAVQDLHLLSSPLLSGDVITDGDYQRKLISILTQVASHRKGEHPWNDARFLNPLQCRFMIAKSNPEWLASMKSRLSQIDGMRPAHTGWFVPLDDKAQWSADLDSVDRLPVIDASEVSLAVVMLNGQEGLNRLKDPSLLLNWVRKLCTDLIEGVDGKGGGVLPVFVIGAVSTVSVAGQQHAIDKAWNQVMEFCFENGIPLLDIRNAQFADGDTPEQLSVRLLGDGLQSLFYQLRWLQRNVKQ